MRCLHEKRDAAQHSNRANNIVNGENKFQNDDNNDNDNTNGNSESKYANAATIRQPDDVVGNLTNVNDVDNRNNFDIFV